MVDIAPTAGTYALFKNFNYSAWTALAELVDNSVSSWIQLREKIATAPHERFNRLALEPLRVEIDTISQPGMVIIRDNAGGIAGPDFDNRAFALATPPEDLTTINQFGVGMKAAACWFANDWSVRTCAVSDSEEDDKIERTLVWNTSKIVENGISEISPKKAVGPKDGHYTEIKMWNLHHPLSAPATMAKVQRYLGRMFRQFIENDHIHILVNGVALHPTKYEVLEAPYARTPKDQPVRWELPIDFNTPNGERVTGRAIVLRTMKKQETALNLYWHNRLIKGNLEPNYRPTALFGGPNSFKTGRLYIELFLDDFTPTVDKQGFVFGASGTSEDELIEMLIGVLDEDAFPLLRQAENYRSGDASANEVDIDKGLEGIVGKFAGTASQAVSSPVGSLQENPYPPSLPAEEASRERSLKVSVEGSTWEVRLVMGTSESDRSLLVITEQPREDEDGDWRLTMRIGNRHPYMVEYFNDSTQEAIYGLLAGIGFGEIMAQNAGARYPSYVRNNIDRFLREALSREA